MGGDGNKKQKIIPPSGLKPPPHNAAYLAEIPLAAIGPGVPVGAQQVPHDPKERNEADAGVGRKVDINPAIV